MGLSTSRVEGIETMYEREEEKIESGSKRVRSGGKQELYLTGFIRKSK
jgi:hypothetical protein